MNSVIKKKRNFKPAYLVTPPAGDAPLPGFPRATGSRKSPKRIILALLLFLVPTLFLGAQQSFFISPGQTIRNGDIADGYCLEYTQRTISNNNISGLLNNIEGIVRVIYTNGTDAVKSLQCLVNDELVYFNAFDSYQHLQFFFEKGSGIEAIVTGEDGIGFFREEITEDEEKLARENIEKIRTLEVQKFLQSEIQQYIWRTRFTRDIPGEDVRTIDFQTTADPAEQVHTRFGGNATVDYTREGREFMRLDGILNGTENFSREITELVSHFHNDHISLAALESLLKEKEFDRLFAPYVTLEVSRNQTFDLLTTILDNPDYNSKLENRMLEITGADTSLTPAHIGNMGDFYYFTFVDDGNIRLDIFKYKNPKNPNKDGAIYQITHKNVGFLLFGDFDDPDGIKNLLDVSAENEKKRTDLEEQRSNLTKQLYELRQGTGLIQGVLGLGALFEIDESTASDNEAQLLLAEFGNQIETLTRTIIGLQREIASLPVLKADVVKWPHHAHIFREANSRDVIIKLNKVVDPRYFIYQVHSAQNLEEFKAYIKDFEFEGKFINSGEKPVKFISLEWLKTQFLNFFTGKQGKTSQGETSSALSGFPSIYLFFQGERT